MKNHSFIQTKVETSTIDERKTMNFKKSYTNKREYDCYVSGITYESYLKIYYICKQIDVCFRTSYLFFVLYEKKI